jgi:hypothetical protein
MLVIGRVETTDDSFRFGFDQPPAGEPTLWATSRIR